MRLTTLSLRFRVALLAVLTIALVATGWAHAAPQASDDVLAFMAETGATPADFCGDVDTGGRHGDPLCQACHIVGGADLPPLAQGALRLELEVETAHFRSLENVTVAGVLDLSHAPQGPPVA